MVTPFSLDRFQKMLMELSNIPKKPPEDHLENTECRNVCPHCGDPNLLTLAWVRIDTDEFVMVAPSSDARNGEIFYCSRCDRNLRLDDIICSCEWEPEEKDEDVLTSAHDTGVLDDQED